MPHRFVSSIQIAFCRGQTAVAQPSLKYARWNAVGMMRCGVGFPEAMELNFVEYGVSSASQSSLIYTMAAVQPGPESRLLQVTEPVPLGSPICADENPARVWVLFAPRFQILDQISGHR